MSPCFARFALACCVPLALMVVIGNVAAQPSCDQWATYDFHRRAGVAAVTPCLRAGADVNARDEDGNTPLHYASAFNDSDITEVVMALVKAGADVNALDNKGDTPLHDWALHRGGSFTWKIVAVLIAAGADINAGAGGGGSVMGRTIGVSTLGMVEKVLILLRGGADPNTDLKGTIGLAWLFRNSSDVEEYWKVVTALLAYGGDSGAGQEEAERFGLLGVYRSASSLEAIRILKESEAAEVAAFDAVVAAFREELRQAEHAARQQKVEKEVQDSMASCDNWNTPPFFRHASAEDVFRCLKSKDLNAKDEQGRTPIHLAALNGKPEVVLALASAGAEADALDGMGLTPLHSVSYFRDAPEIVAALVKAGADPEAKDAKGRTPLEFAETFSELTAMVAALRSAQAGVVAVAGFTDIRESNQIMWAAKRSNLRSGPGTEFTKVGLLQVGEEVRVTGEIENWFRVETARGSTAFVFMPLLVDIPTIGEERPN